MSESIPQNESFEVLLSEEQVFETITNICAGKSFTETRRVERGGKLRELEVRLDEPNAEGYQVQLDYTVNSVGEVTIDATYYDPGKGFDYRPGMGYEPQDIVAGATLARFVSGAWLVENSL